VEEVEEVTILKEMVAMEVLVGVHVSHIQLLEDLVLLIKDIQAVMIYHLMEHQNLVLEAVVPEKSDLMRYLLHTHMVLVVLVEMVCHLRLLVVM
jgi:hypothetical protein